MRARARVEGSWEVHARRGKSMPTILECGESGSGNHLGEVLQSNRRTKALGWTFQTSSYLRRGPPAIPSPRPPRTESMHARVE